MFVSALQNPLWACFLKLVEGPFGLGMASLHQPRLHEIVHNFGADMARFVYSDDPFTSVDATVEVLVGWLALGER